MNTLVKASTTIFVLIIFQTLAFSGNTEKQMNATNDAALFIENKGQFADNTGKVRNDFQYKLELPGMNAYFKPDGIMYHFYRSEKKQMKEFSDADMENFKKGDFNAVSRKVFFFRMDMKLLGANIQSASISEKKQSQYFNYYFSHCPDGIHGVNSFEEITYTNVYPNIDVRYYFQNNQLKYDFVVRPGGDVRNIKLLYDGATSLNIEDGRLKVSNDFSEFQEDAPYTYYSTNNKEIKSRFTLKENIVSFELENFDATQTIVIDPAISWASYYGNNYGSDFHSNSATDANGNIYVAFSTYAANWPVINAGGGQWYDNTRDGSTDIVIARINSNYSKQWATYYGGTGSDFLCGTGGDYGKTIGVDASNNVYIGGYTNGASNGFPTAPSAALGAFYISTSKNGDNAFLIKMNPNGERQWATIFNHEQATTNSAGMRINGICVKGSKIYFTGETYRSNNLDIPLRTLSGAYNNSTYVGDQDPFLGRFNTDCVLEWCTYVNAGNTANKAYKMGSDLHVDASGNLIYAGQFGSGNAASGYLLNPGGGAYYSSTNAGNYDLHIIKFNANMSPVWATYYGSDNLDRVSEVTTDANGNILVAFRTVGGSNLPTANPGGAFVYTTKQSPGNWSSNFSQDGGITKFTSSGALYWATYVGGTNNNTTSIPAISTDGAGNIYVMGYTNTTNFPVQNLSGSYNQSTSAGGNELVLMKFSSAGVLQWSTYYGGSANESCYGLKIAASSSSDACGSYTQFGIFSTTSASIPTFNPGSPAFYETSKTTSGANAVMLLKQTGGGGGGGGTPGIWGWTGAVNTDWFEPCNWDKLSVPTATSPVVIPNTSNKPVIANGNAHCLNIELQSSSGATLTIRTDLNGDLQVHQ